MVQPAVWVQPEGLAQGACGLSACTGPIAGKPAPTGSPLPLRLRQSCGSRLAGDRARMANLELTRFLRRRPGAGGRALT